MMRRWLCRMFGHDWHMYHSSRPGLLRRCTRCSRREMMRWFADDHEYGWTDVNNSSPEDP